jgi:hypothetical protein
MKVHGLEITSDQIAAGEAVFEQGMFAKKEVTLALVMAGVPEFVNTLHWQDRMYHADRVADRILQQAKSRKEIFLDKTTRMWVKA